MEMSLVNAASNAAPAQVAVANNVLRKSLDAQQQNVASLLQALPQPATVNPPNLGQNVDVRA
ncbi:YjfB family protein [Chitiniphilus eburneus]|uniref:Putative motility protein n=1 Tax=Chitiniphilus eburneus TaxID=2571148 RepID=A0A4U0PWC4_9NEIS|nr:YjfB family protein [Chitiniphilus eburneus]TJZ72861.1 putative motility protein [Chitiniphilus eburneus]